MQRELAVHKRRKGRGRERYGIQTAPGPKSLLKGSCFQVQGMSFHGIKASVDAMHRMKACAAPRQWQRSPKQRSEDVLKELTWAISKYRSSNSFPFIKESVSVVLINYTWQSLLSTESFIFPLRKMAVSVGSLRRELQCACLHWLNESVSCCSLIQWVSLRVSNPQSLGGFPPGRHCRIQAGFQGPSPSTCWTGEVGQSCRDAPQTLLVP